MIFCYYPNRTTVKSAIVTHKLKGETWKGYIVGIGTTLGVYFVEKLTDNFAEWLPLAHISIDYVKHS